MKKTLITVILAMGFAASASAAALLELDKADLASAGGSYSTADWPSYDGNCGLVFTMVLDATKFQNTIKGGSVTDTNLITAANGASTPLKIGIGLNTHGGTTGLFGSWGNDTTFERGIAPLTGTTIDLNDLQAHFQANTYESIALSYSLHGDGTFPILTLVDSAGNVTSIAGNDGALKSSSYGAMKSFTYNTDYIQYLTINEASGYSWADTISEVETPLNVKAIEAAKLANAVPEPATATLSLLALAGLAARRRRK